MFNRPFLMLRPLSLAALLALTACDSTPVAPVVEDDAVAPLRSSVEAASFSRDVARPFGIVMTADGGLDAQGTGSFHANAAGLWLGTGDEATAEASVVWAGSSHRSNVGATCGSDLFALDADTTYTDAEAWPRDLGAPTTADGSPRVYGDRMLWGAFCAVPAGDLFPQLQTPVSNLRFSMAAYDYERADLAGVRFVRYEITNTGSTPVPALRTGYYSDTDLSAGRDAVGFDPGSGLSYAYSLYTQADGSFHSPMVTGFAFLDTPEGAPLKAHRIMRKNNYVDPAFGELGFEDPAPFVRALDGLSNDGDAMIDPTTGEASLFAFTGDPFAGTGWRDGLSADGTYAGIDVRHMTSASPITLAPGETTVATVVWVTASKGTPQASHAQVLQTLAAVRAEPALWRF